MEARYLRIKNWGEFQHYRDKEPGWIKLYAKAQRQNDFLELGEQTQWQLVRVWLYASQSSRHTLDEEGRKVPAIPDDERTLRTGIRSLRKIPMAQLIREKWLIPVAAEELLDEIPSRPALEPVYGEASSLASAGANGRASARSITRGLEKKEKEPRAVTPTRDAQPSNVAHIRDTISRALEAS